MAKRNYSSKRSTSSKIKRGLKRPVKKTLAALSRKSSGFKRLYRSFKIRFRKHKFNKFDKLPVDGRVVVFEAFSGREYADSPRAIYEYMVNSPDYEDYRFVWVFKDRCMDKYLFLEQNPRTSLVLWGTPDHYRTYATAGYWITNTWVIMAMKRKPEQTYVQCWHGTPLKRLGFDIEVDRTKFKKEPDNAREVFETDARKYSYMVSPSAYATEKFISAFNLRELGKEDIIIEEGYPRNDYLVNYKPEDVGRIRSSLGIPEGKKVILYAPTFRDDQRDERNEYHYESPLDFGHIQEVLGDEYVILFRAHYYVANAFNFEDFDGFVINASSYPEINELYVASDMLITDYSSVFFDYGVLKRPMLFYMYDLENYANNLRGFYISLDELPGPIVKTQAELEESLTTVDKWFESEEYREKYRRFNEKFTYLEDGHATERVVDKVFAVQVK